MGNKGLGSGPGEGPRVRIARLVDIDNALIETHVNKYMCFVCVLSSVGVYPNTSHINNWKLIILEPSVVGYVDDVESNVEYCSDDGKSNCLISMLNVGNNFVVQTIISNGDNDVFWILKCTS